MHELAMHPEIQDRLRREILDALNETDGKITYEMVCKHILHTFLFYYKKIFLTKQKVTLVLPNLKYSFYSYARHQVLSLPYLDMVVSEGLRMYAPLPFLDRVAVESYKVPNSDFIIEKNTPIYISMSGIHYDPEYYPDPYKFDPERFNEENKRNRPPCVYLPFGDGPRVCIGKNIDFDYEN